MADYEASLCTGCGQPKAESMGPGDPNRYDAVAHLCVACETVQIAARQDAKDHGQPTPGLYWGVKHREG